MARIALREICGFRSGDKGDIANVALLADDAEIYEVITREVTVERVKAHFGPLVHGRVVRYEADNVLGLNFVLHGALGGGAPQSLRADNLGKTMGSNLIRLEIDVPDSLAGRRRPRADVTWADEILARLPQR